MQMSFENFIVCYIGKPFSLQKIVIGLGSCWSLSVAFAQSSRTFLVAYTQLYKLLRWSVGHAIEIFVEKMLKQHHCSCPPVRDWCCRVYGLVWVLLRGCVRVLYACVCQLFSRQPLFNNIHVCAMYGEVFVKKPVYRIQDYRGWSAVPPSKKIVNFFR